MKQKGFTIIELIISIFILTVGIVGIFTAFNMVVILTSDAGNRLVATYMAQEGMEIIRNIRDTNWINENDWRCGLADVSGSSKPCDIGSQDCAGGCEADYTTTGTSEFPLFPYSSLDYLNINTSGFYGYQTCPPTNPDCRTQFQRKIIITPVADVDGDDKHILKVKVEATWDQKSTILSQSYSASYRDSSTGECDPHNCIVVEGYLYDWYVY